MLSLLNLMGRIYIGRTSTRHIVILTVVVNRMSAGRTIVCYCGLQNHRKETGKAPRELEEVVFDIKHTAPQHRQYLTFEVLVHYQLSNYYHDELW